MEEMSTFVTMFILCVVQLSTQSRDINGDTFETNCHQVVNCAGPWAAQIGELAGMGTETGALSIPLPVLPR